MLPEEINSLADLRPGDIGFGPIHGNIGIGIRVALAILDGGAPYQHVFMITEAIQKATAGFDEYDPPMAVEAMPGGAVEVDISMRWTSKNCYVRPNYADVTQAEYAAQTAKQLIGTPYSFLDYYALAAHHLHLPSKLVDNYIKSSKHMICSQLVDHCLASADWHVFNDGRLPQDVTPSALYYKLDKWQPRLVFAYPE